MSNTIDREKEIFNQALDISSAEARALFLRKACAEDPALRQRIEAWLAAHESAEGFLSTREVDQTLLMQTPVSEGPGTRIGRYKLLQQIGEGGMGVVYMAEQEEPVRRRVALKIIKLGMDTKQVVARFEAERQALALMDHPNIAKVLDGGATETGRPYFVMELVQGVPITEFCDKGKLSARDRLNLFLPVCQAIQSAHQKGVIHRDIKPSNVLVTLHDGVPVPKVIDFGIAKATNQKLTEKTLFTNFATMIGTPAYMSPEQAEMSGMDIDTRADIYSLGVLLYELLTGSTPFPEKRLRSLAYGEMQRVILEEEPERPSTRLSTLEGEQKTVIARNRGQDFASLSNLLRGDLDWIVMKCLEKDRSRRYETANGLAQDIERHLENEPVIARPPSAAYRFHKLIRRRKGPIIASGAIAFCLIGALIFSTTAYLKEKKARIAAAAAERASAAATERAKSETVRADNVSSFVTGFLQEVIPDLDFGGYQDAIRNLLERAEQFATALTNAPQAEAAIRGKIAEGYFGALHDHEKGEEQNAAIEHLAQTLGPAGKDFERASRFARSFRALWERQDTNAIPALQSIGDESLASHPPNDVLAAYCFGNIASYYSFFGPHDKAQAFAHQTLAYARTTNDSTHLGFQMFASEILMRVNSMRGSLADAEAAADGLLSPLKLANTDGTLKERTLLEMFLGGIREGDRYHIPERSLRLILDELPAKQSLTRGHLTGILGAVVARRGDWTNGLDLLLSSVTNATCDVATWNAAAHVAALTTNSAVHRVLIVRGLSQFGNGASAESSRLLLEPILAYNPDFSVLPALKPLVDRLGDAPPWARHKAAAPRALFAFYNGQYLEAAKLTEEALPAPPEKLKLGLDPYWAGALFVGAMAKERLGLHEESLALFNHAIRLHSTSLSGPGIPYKANEWTGACEAELLRRQAIATLAN